MQPETEGLPLWLTIILLFGGGTAAVEVFRALLSKWTGRAETERAKNKEEADRFLAAEKRNEELRNELDAEIAKRRAAETYSHKLRLCAISHGVKTSELPVVGEIKED